MRSQDVQIGTLVQVSKLHREPDYRGQIGTVTRRYGHVDYAAFDVQLGDGCPVLFWHHEFEEAQ